MLQDFLEALLSSFWLPHTSNLGNITQRCSWFDASFYLLCRLLLLITSGSTIVPDRYFGFGNSFCFWRRQMCQTFHFRNPETKQHLVPGLTHLIAYTTHQIASLQDRCPNNVQYQTLIHTLKLTILWWNNMGYLSLWIGFEVSLCSMEEKCCRESAYLCFACCWEFSP
jgi:hypothetical protein